MEGLNVVDHLDLQTRFLAELSPLVAQGKIKSEEHLFMGLENGIAAFLSLFDGSAKAKPVIVVDPQYA
jgi:NADPH-dependent curcumin reductase CurA